MLRRGRRVLWANIPVLAHRRILLRSGRLQMIGRGGERGMHPFSH